MTERASFLYLSLCRLFLKLVFNVRSVSSDLIGHGRRYKEGRYFADKPSLKYCAEGECSLSRSSLPDAIKLNIIKLPTIIKNTGMIFRKHTISSNYLIFKSTTTHVNISSTAGSSNFAQIATFDFGQWRTKSIFLTSGCLGHKSSSFSRHKTTPSLSPTSRWATIIFIGKVLFCLVTCVRRIPSVLYMTFSTDFAWLRAFEQTVWQQTKSPKTPMIEFNLSLTLSVA